MTDGNSNGIAAVAGSIFNTGTIDGVTVKNADITGNRWVGGIAGFVYGNIMNCTVENVELTATPDNLTRSFDNGDKVGGIVGLLAGDSAGKVKGNKVESLSIKAYRDMVNIRRCILTKALKKLSCQNLKACGSSP